MNKRILLQSGCYIEFSSKSVRFYSSNGEELDEVRADSSIAKILAELLKTPGKIVDYDVLFPVTRKALSHRISKTPPQVVSSAVSKLPEEVKKDIVNKRNEGFKILLADGAEPYYRTHGEIQDMCGEYYALYLDPATKDPNGQILQAFIRVYPDGSSESKMAAVAILRIQSLELLNNIASEFARDSDFFSRFDEYHSTLDSTDQDCFLMSGEVKNCGQNVVAITLQNQSGATEIIDRWNIVLNLKDYMVDTRQRTSGDEYYRGGAGLIVGGWTKWGIISSHIVLIRKPQNTKNAKLLKHEDVRPFLLATNHVRVDETLDKAFYIWLMKKWPVTLLANN